MKITPIKTTMVLGAAISFAVPGMITAAPITWDGAGDGTTYEDDTNWTGIPDDTAPTDDLTTDVATFTGDTVDLSTTRQVSGLDYDSGSTLSGTGSIEIGTSGIEVNADSVINTAGLIFNQANTNITFDGGRLSWGTSVTASGIGAVTLTGDDTLFVDGGANTYSGGTTITGEAIASIKNGDALGTGPLTLDNGTLQTNGANWNFDETITVNAGGGTIDANNNVITLNSTAVISGTGATTYKATAYGDSIRINNTVNTYTGGTTIDNTKVLIKNTNALSTGDVTLQNSGTIKNWNSSPNVTNNIIVDSSGGGIEAGWNKTMTLSGAISGVGELTIRPDSGTVKMNNNANSYSGGTKILGLIAVENGNNQLGTGTITFDGGFMRNDNSTCTFAQDVVFAAGGAEIKVGWIAQSRRLEFTGVISGPGALIVSDDEAHLRLLNTGNTYSGGTEIRGLVNAVSGGLGSGNITLNDENGARGWLQNWLGAATHSNNLIISDANFGGRLKAGWGSDLEFTGVVSGAGTLAVEGDSGTAVFSGTANTFTGDINLLATNSRLRVASLGTAGTYSGNVSGDGIFDYAFPTTPTLDGAYTHTGGTAISNVTVLASDFTQLNCFNGGQNIILAAGGTLDVEGTAIANGFLNPEGGTLLNSGAAVDLSSNSFTSNGGTFTVDGTGDVTLGDMTRTAGNPTVIKQGANTLNLTGATDNVAFQATVENGTLVLAKASTASVHAVSTMTVNGGTAELGGSGNDQIYNGGTLNMNGGTFNFGAFNERIKFLNLVGGNITGTGTLTVNTFSGAGFIDAQSGTVAVPIGGDAPLTKSTAGTVTLSGGGTYGGDTTINEGTLILGATNDLADASIIYINGATSVLQLDDTATDTVEELWIDGVPMAAGTWGTTASAATNKDDVHFSGLGVLSVTSMATGYTTWAGDQGLTLGVNDGETDDPDFDGIENVLEYILGGLALTSDTSILPNGATNGANYELTFKRTDDSELDATTSVEFGSDLTLFPTTTAVVPAADGTVNGVTFTIIENGSDADDVTASIPHGGATEFFGRVDGILNP